MCLQNKIYEFSYLKMNWKKKHDCQIKNNCLENFFNKHKKVTTWTTLSHITIFRSKPYHKFLLTGMKPLSVEHSVRTADMAPCGMKISQSSRGEEK